MSEPSVERGSVFAAADRLLSLNAQGEEAKRLLQGLLESLHRMACTPADHQNLRIWLDGYTSAIAVLPWRLLLQLSESTAAESWPATLAALKRLLPLASPRPDLYIRTQTARQVYRWSNDPVAAEACFHSTVVPDPAFQETAVGAVCLRLRLSAAAGNWQEHDGLASRCDPAWIKSAGRQAGWVKVIIAEHAIQRGLYAAALDLLETEVESTEERLCFAVLETLLRALLAVGGEAPGEVIAEQIALTSERLKPLLAKEEPADEEGCARFQRANEMLDRARSIRVSVEPGDEDAILVKVEEALLRDAGWATTGDAGLRGLLRWVALVLDRRGAQVAEVCESLLGAILAEARRLKLTIVELLALDRRAIVRARYLGLLKEAVDDAGEAARVALGLLAANPQLEVERGLRSSFLPAFDRALELITEASLLRPEKMVRGRQERFGRALLDYAEQLADLALSEARVHILSGGAKTPGFPTVEGPVQKRTETLQAALRPGVAVLQYLVVGRFLLVFVYGQRFFAWESTSLGDEGTQRPVAIRTYLEKNYLGPWRQMQAERWSRIGVREVMTTAPPPSTRRWSSSEECLGALAHVLLPPAVAKALRCRRVRHLSIVPHDILYQTPFSSLPWRNTRLGERFTLSLHPTGELAGASADAGRWAEGPPIQVGFFKGTGLMHTSPEQAALTAALYAYAEIKEVDTTVEGQGGREMLARTAPDYDVVHLACHGSETRLSLGPDGSAGISLREAAQLDLRRCRIAVLQACRTGWMTHRREFPVQGFPQALLDAGAATVVAPMFPVHDALCPIFASVFGRALRFLPACEALRFTLKILRRHGAVFLAAQEETRAFLNVPDTFDAYEYRFTGDPKVGLPGGWLKRLFARVKFAIWLGRIVWDGRRGR
ncbi:MAG TPA: hypothetical protein DD490_04350 [Acidobacteria bacterium]|nr:hypothetical protein [Acidobacteriota bacterium]